MARNTTRVATVTTPAPEAPTTAPTPAADSKPVWHVTTFTNRGRSKVPPPAWAYEIVDATYASKQALGHDFGSEKAAKSAKHQVQRVCDEKGYGLSAEIIGGELRVQAKVKKQVTPKPAASSNGAATLNPQQLAAIGAS